MDPAALHIRAAGHADLSALLDLYQHLIPDDPRPTPEAADDILDRFAAYAGSAIFMGFVQGAPVVACSLIVVPNLTRGGRPFGLIENVVTHRNHRRRGFGRQALHHACAAAWQAGCYKVMLLTGATDPQTLDFYRNSGFEATKTGFQMRQIAPRHSLL